MNPKVSLIMITARGSRPYLDSPEMHLFEPTLESLKMQTFKEFELVIVDACFGERKDYYKNLDYDFAIKHLDALPNPWLERGLPSVCRMYNKGIANSEGELLMFMGDSYMMPEDFAANLWKHHLEGWFTLPWYMREYSKQEYNYGADGRSEPSTEFERSPVNYKILDYQGEKVAIEHRPKQLNLFQCQSAKPPWNWWFGLSTATRQAILDVNGFDSRFDPDRMLIDADIAQRFVMLGYHKQFRMFSDTFLVRLHGERDSWGSNIRKILGITMKCNYPLYWLNQKRGWSKANTHKLSKEDYGFLESCQCVPNCYEKQAGRCNLQKPWQFTNPELRQVWQKNQGIMSLNV